MKDRNQESNLAKDLTWGIRKAFGSPDCFMVVDRDNRGEYEAPKGYSTISELGAPQTIHHLCTNTIPHEAISWELTKFNHYNNKKANAYHIIDRHPNGKNYEITTVMPLRVKVEAIVNFPTEKNHLMN